MIQHSVIFKLKYPNDSGEMKSFMHAAEKLAAIPGVQQFEILKQVNAKNSFEYGIAMAFESHDAYQHYTNHPDHQQFIQDFWIPNVEEFLEIDYEPLHAE